MYLLLSLWYALSNEQASARELEIFQGVVVVDRKLHD